MNSMLFDELCELGIVKQASDVVVPVPDTPVAASKELTPQENPPAIQQLRLAKAHSDRGRYNEKREILRRLIMARPHDWVVDQPNKYHPGVTHVPTKFKLHTDRELAKQIPTVKQAVFAPLINPAGPAKLIHRAVVGTKPLSRRGFLRGMGAKTLLQGTDAIAKPIQNAGTTINLLSKVLDSPGKINSALDVAAKGTDLATSALSNPVITGLGTNLLKRLRRVTPWAVAGSVGAASLPYLMQLLKMGEEKQGMVKEAISLQTVASALQKAEPGSPRWIKLARQVRKWLPGHLRRVQLTKEAQRTEELLKQAVSARLVMRALRAVKGDPDRWHQLASRVQKWMNPGVNSLGETVRGAGTRSLDAVSGHEFSVKNNLSRLLAGTELQNAARRATALPKLSLVGDAKKLRKFLPQRHVSPDDMDGFAADNKLVFMGSKLQTLPVAPGVLMHELGHSKDYMNAMTRFISRRQGNNQTLRSSLRSMFQGPTSKDTYHSELMANRIASQMLRDNSVRKSFRASGQSLPSAQEYLGWSNNKQLDNYRLGVLQDAIINQQYGTFNPADYPAAINRIVPGPGSLARLSKATRTSVADSIYTQRVPKTPLRSRGIPARKPAIPPRPDRPVKLPTPIVPDSTAPALIPPSKATFPAGSVDNKFNTAMPDPLMQTKQGEESMTMTALKTTPWPVGTSSLSAIPAALLDNFRKRFRMLSHSQDYLTRMKVNAGGQQTQLMHAADLFGGRAGQAAKPVLDRVVEKLAARDDYSAEGAAVGATAGATPPLVRLLQYLNYDVPKFREVVNGATELAKKKSDGTWSHGTSHLNKLLRTGDVGVAGWYDNFKLDPKVPLDYILGAGSGYAGGAPGIHGVYVAPRASVGVNAGKPILLHGGTYFPKEPETGWRRAIGSAYLSAGDLLGDLLNPESRSKVDRLLPAIRERINQGRKHFAKSTGKDKKLIERLAGKPGLLNAYANESPAEHVKYYSRLGNRPFIFFRSKTPLSPAQLSAGTEQILGDAVKPYDIFGALGAAAKSVFVPRTGEIGNAAGQVGSTCSAAGHCGSVPARILQSMGLLDRGSDASSFLPSDLFLNKNLSPVGVFRKDKMLSHITNAARGRTAIGLGAAGLAASGAALAGGLGGSLLPKLKPYYSGLSLPK